ncbi:mucin-6-like, partial [Menidia menidia]
MSALTCTRVHERAREGSYKAPEPGGSGIPPESLGRMTTPPQRRILALCLGLFSVFWTGEAVNAGVDLETEEAPTYTCRTFGSGVFQPFLGEAFHLDSDCFFTLLHFSVNSGKVEVDISLRRGAGGLLTRVDISINQVRTVLRNGSILVEDESVSVPFDHTYQHIYRYGVYTRLKSALLPLTLTWEQEKGGVGTLWVELKKNIPSGVSGLCVNSNHSESLLKPVGSCVTKDADSTVDKACQNYMSHAYDCENVPLNFPELCYKNINFFKNKNIEGLAELKEYSRCSFAREVIALCSETKVLDVVKKEANCADPTCPGDLQYSALGPAFGPTCSNPTVKSSDQEVAATCTCPPGLVLNNHVEGYHCVPKASCPCVATDGFYQNGDVRTTKCRQCTCREGSWECSANTCPSRCQVEGHFVITFDGKQYEIPGNCRYQASRGQNWTVTVQYSEKEKTLTEVQLQVFQDVYTFTKGLVRFGDLEVKELHQSDHALVFWQSSMFVQVHAFVGLKLQVQVFPDLQLYITPPSNESGLTSGLCGNNNNDTTDDFTTPSQIIESSVQYFASAWSFGKCPIEERSCVKSVNELIGREKCSELTNSNGIFAKCHQYIPPDHHYEDCVTRVCNCEGKVTDCVCTALGNYAKFCAERDVQLGDWRKETSCTVACEQNQVFSYETAACNRTCRSLSGPDPRCALGDDPVEGCGCPGGTHLGADGRCVPQSDCGCQHPGGVAPPGPVTVDGQPCICKDGKLSCSKDCGCKNGKVCVRCSENPVETDRKTCSSLSKPLSSNGTCVSGCYCPDGQFEDDDGNCVSEGNCTCNYGGKSYRAGEEVTTNCKRCVCGQGVWTCHDRPCVGKCQVYGNGHYQTFDSKWYRFDGQCQYTLVEDLGGNFSVRVESVPCCDEHLTCSRSIVLDLEELVSLRLSDMKVTRRLLGGWSVGLDSLYSSHTVGLYIIISVPSKGLTLIWDKHTRLTVELSSSWRRNVRGLCGNFNSNEMDDLKIEGSDGATSSLAFGNSWRAATPPCSNVTKEYFPCEHNSYCKNWAERRCLLLKQDLFKPCHLKVDPEPFYSACVQESCSCEFEGKFLGFCTAVAAYAEACSEQDVCVNWRTPDLCPVYCDYYNDQGQCSWHYDPCGSIRTCGKASSFTKKLEGCYPRCPKEAPYYDENVRRCTPQTNCTCFYNDTIVPPGRLQNASYCNCENGKIHCTIPTTTPTTTITTTTISTTTSTSPTTTPYTTTPTTTITSTTTPTTTSTTSTTITTTTPTTTPSTTITPTTTPTTTSTTSTTITTTTPTTTPSTTITPTTTPTTTSTTSTTITTTTPTTTPSTTTPTTTTSTTSTTITTTTPTTTPSTTTPTTTTTSTTITTTSPTTTPTTTITTTSPTTTPTTTITTTTPTTTPSTTTPTTTSTTSTTITTTTPTTTPSTTSPTTTTTSTTITTTSPTTTPTTTITTTTPTTTPSTTTPTTTSTTSTTITTTSPTTTPTTTITTTSPTTTPTTTITTTTPTTTPSTTTPTTTSTTSTTITTTSPTTTPTTTITTTTPTTTPSTTTPTTTTTSTTITTTTPTTT